MPYQNTPNQYDWLAPYALAAVGFWLLFMIFRLIETWYANKQNRLLYRDILIFRKLSRKQKEHLSQNFSFYNQLDAKQKRRFEHRVARFIGVKEFVGREGLEVTQEMKLLIAAVGCMLTFGRKHYQYRLVDYILVYPEPFYSHMNDAYHKGEFNPMQKALVLSWKDFEQGYHITDDNLNLGIHEFMHALQLDARQSNDIDALRFERQFQKILHRLTDPSLKQRLDEVKYFRAYAFTNQYEFMAVLAEYFFESPADFRSNFPKVYEHTRTLLNFDFAHY
ncbi:MAG: hypothetical protein CL867_03845 [Cytophagaceae bacterium]|nr:hypothetical protein [Cytophagaceae bacterium]